MSGPGTSTGKSPSPTVPLSYLVTAVAAFVLACAAVPGVVSVDVRITFDPPWTPERIKLDPRA